MIGLLAVNDMANRFLLLIGLLGVNDRVTRCQR